MITEAATVQDIDEALTHMAYEWHEAGEERRLVLGAYVDALLDKRLALSGCGQVQHR